MKRQTIFAAAAGIAAFLVFGSAFQYALILQFAYSRWGEENWAGPAMLCAAIVVGLIAAVTIYRLVIGKERQSDTARR